MFTTEFTGVNETLITDYDGLRTLGDQKTQELVQTLAAMTSSASPGPGGAGGRSCLTHVSISLILISIFAMVMSWM